MSGTRGESGASLAPRHPGRREPPHSTATSRHRSQRSAISARPWEFGYPFALGLMALVSIMPYVIFRQRRWP
ncbi:hypothetical protein E0F15_20740 [Frankia sp. B2]|nr:hypothetical protein E0F15_20740 [Frankia sp. B2]